MHKHITLGNKISSMFPVVRRKVLSYVGNADTADDVTQELMLKLLRSKAIPQRPSPNWFNTVARNAVAGFFRCKRRENKYIDSNWVVDTLGLHYDVTGEERYCQSVVLDDNIEPDCLPVVDKVVSAMPKQERQTLLLYANGYTYQQIAAMTKANLGTVKSRLHYARKRAQPLLALYR